MRSHDTVGVGRPPPVAPPGPGRGAGRDPRSQAVLQRSGPLANLPRAGRLAPRSSPCQAFPWNGGFETPA
eukprot:15456351-Alexandrium_andersonii.AAC.1